MDYSEWIDLSDELREMWEFEMLEEEEEGDSKND